MIEKNHNNVPYICQYTHTKQNYCFEGYIKYYIIKTGLTSFNINCQEIGLIYIYALLLCA